MAHSWWLNSAAPLGNQAVITMTWFPTQSHYPDTEPSSNCPIVMPSTGLGSDKYQFDKSLVWLDRGLNPRSPTHKTNDLLIQPPRPVNTHIHIHIYIYTYYICMDSHRARMSRVPAPEVLMLESWEPSTGMTGIPVCVRINICIITSIHTTQCGDSQPPDTGYPI